MVHGESPSIDPAVFDTLVERLEPDSRVGVLSGAGISAASGVPTFRGDGGLWKKRRAEDLATPEAFARDPELVWEWYGWRRDSIRDARPNPAHTALVELDGLVRDVRIATQNVDGLHALADPDGTVDRVELHGSIWRTRCTSCDHERTDREPGPAPGEVRRCHCGGLARPAVVWFGEALREQDLQAAAAYAQLADVFLVVGTSAVVQPAASFADIARYYGAHVASFQIEEESVSGAAHDVVVGPAEVTLPALVTRVREARA